MGRRRGWNEQPADKPYRFVEIASLSPEDRSRPPGHDRYTGLSGQLEATLAVITPLHVGSGALELRDDGPYPLVRGMTRSNDRVIVPASTLKGMVRSVVEAITPSCVRITKVRGKQLPQTSGGCSDKDKLCTSCRMFGATGRGWGYQGNVRFTDAVLRDEYQLIVVGMPALYGPGSKSTIPYFDGGEIQKQRGKLMVFGGKAKGRKFYRHGQTVTDGPMPVEACPGDSHLDFTLAFDNLSEAEVGVLLTGLGLGSPQLVLKVGAGKPACYGSVLVEMKPGSLQVWGSAADLYGEYDIEREPAEANQYIEAASSLIDANRLRELARILRFDQSRQCPSGNY